MKTLGLSIVLICLTLAGLALPATAGTEFLKYNDVPVAEGSVAVLDAPACDPPTYGDLIVLSTLLRYGFSSIAIRAQSRRSWELIDAALSDAPDFLSHHRIAFADFSYDAGVVQFTGLENREFRIHLLGPDETLPTGGNHVRVFTHDQWSPAAGTTALQQHQSLLLLSPQDSSWSAERQPLEQIKTEATEFATMERTYRDGRTKYYENEAQQSIAFVPFLRSPSTAPAPTVIPPTVLRVCGQFDCYTGNASIYNSENVRQALRIGLERIARELAIDQGARDAFAQDFHKLYEFINVNYYQSASFQKSSLTFFKLLRLLALKQLTPRKTIHHCFRLIKTSMVYWPTVMRLGDRALAVLRSSLPWLKIAADNPVSRVAVRRTTAAGAVATGVASYATGAEFVLSAVSVGLSLWLYYDLAKPLWRAYHVMREAHPGTWIPSPIQYWHFRNFQKSLSPGKVKAIIGEYVLQNGLGINGESMRLLVTENDWPLITGTFDFPYATVNELYNLLRNRDMVTSLQSLAWNLPDISADVLRWEIYNNPTTLLRMEFFLAQRYIRQIHSRKNLPPELMEFFPQQEQTLRERLLVRFPYFLNKTSKDADFLRLIGINYAVVAIGQRDPSIIGTSQFWDNALDSLVAVKAGTKLAVNTRSHRRQLLELLPLLGEALMQNFPQLFAGKLISYEGQPIASFTDAGIVFAEEFARKANAEDAEQVGHLSSQLRNVFLPYCAEFKSFFERHPTTLAQPREKEVTSLLSEQSGNFVWDISRQIGALQRQRQWSLLHRFYEDAQTMLAARRTGWRSRLLFQQTHNLFKRRFQKEFLMELQTLLLKVLILKDRNGAMPISGDKDYQDYRQEFAAILTRMEQATDGALNVFALMRGDPYVDLADTAAVRQEVETSLAPGDKRGILGYTWWERPFVRASRCAKAVLGLSR